MANRNNLSTTPTPKIPQIKVCPHCGEGILQPTEIETASTVYTCDLCGTKMNSMGGRLKSGKPSNTTTQKINELTLRNNTKSPKDYSSDLLQPDGGKNDGNSNSDSESTVTTTGSNKEIDTSFDDGIPDNPQDTYRDNPWGRDSNNNSNNAVNKDNSHDNNRNSDAPVINDGGTTPNNITDISTGIDSGSGINDAGGSDIVGGTDAKAQVSRENANAENTEYRGNSDGSIGVANDDGNDGSIDNDNRNSVNVRGSNISTATGDKHDATIRGDRNNIHKRSDSDILDNGSNVNGDDGNRGGVDIGGDCANNSNILDDDASNSAVVTTVVTDSIVTTPVTDSPVTTDPIVTTAVTETAATADSVTDDDSITPVTPTADDTIVTVTTSDDDSITTPVTTADDSIVTHSLSPDDDSIATPAADDSVTDSLSPETLDNDKNKKDKLPLRFCRLNLESSHDNTLIKIKGKPYISKEQTGVAGTGVVGTVGGDEAGTTVGAATGTGTETAAAAAAKHSKVENNPEADTAPLTAEANLTGDDSVTSIAVDAGTADVTSIAVTPAAGTAGTVPANKTIESVHQKLRYYYSNNISVGATSDLTGIDPATIHQHFRRWYADAQAAMDQDFADQQRETKLRSIQAIDNQLARLLLLQDEVEQEVKAWITNNTFDGVRPALIPGIFSKQRIRADLARDIAMLQDTKAAVAMTPTIDDDIASRIKKFLKEKELSDHTVI